ncbi:MAG: aspartate kinase, partial [Nitrososphaerota archaeon]|nr:aspartate kinase [Nitrososphaerota archaeon]
VPVVCGFMGLNGDGRIQTLGRGGSDTSAVVLGSCLGAREVVLLKDVGAALTADPKKTNGTRTIDTLDASEALALSMGGSKLIHAKAFRYLKGTNLRITSIELGLEGGTLIDGQTSVNLTALDRDISMVTLVTRRATMDLVNSIGKILKEAGAELLGMTLGGRSLLLYLKGGSNVVDSLHSKLVNGEEVKAISEINNLAEITVRSDFLERAPGYISDITAPLSANEINIYGISTISNSIKLYILAKDLHNALNLIKKELEDREL